MATQNHRPEVRALPQVEPNFSPAGYFLRVVLWLPIFFVLWYFLAGFFNIVPGLMSQGLINVFDSGAVLSLESVGRKIDYVTRFVTSVEGSQRKGNVIITLNPLIYSWNIPVLLALCFAVSDRLFSNARVILAVAALFPLHAWGLAAEFYVTILFKSAPEVAGQLSVSQWQKEAAALCYQFGYLMLPVIGAASLWFIANRALIEQLITEKTGTAARASK
ncbi:exosortase H-associated membrane protein [Gilvimarinus sp. SDUM040013]|uniref:Exosortase H-associated membrane protein n=1 Tax=Gilvimarinus gilvus TaxID=3058038 RepID=A0ABU4S1I9_9GAMM|nr:exosortase H-associated membrane protein [Gilvimarinus sp. SDUM040013]MDO3388103.1 exosortase H-associated membrane protein [Gilvimarinus sp. SDUM040013]MDX6850322.1 exosortase H-associated membrane protein [Gilvimarinus sp. SDUM040013]